MVEAEGKAALPREDAYLTKRLNDGKLDRKVQPQQLPYQPLPERCPECGSQKLYRDGWRHTPESSIQRFLCRNCGYRFSQGLSKLNQQVKVPGQFRALKPCPDLAEPSVRKRDFSVEKLLNDGSLTLGEDIASHTVTDVGKGLNNLRSYSCKRQVCESLTRGSKNLSSVAKTEIAAGEESQSKEVKGLIIQFMAWLEKEGYAKETRYPNSLKTLARLGANLLDPENVKQVLGKHNMKNGAKMQYAYAYSAFLKMLKISWDPPKLKQEETLPFIPDEKELDQLIAACRSRRMAAYLQCLKETFADPGEALRLRWVDISNNVITINRPVKGHLPRRIEVSNRLIAMLNALPKTSEQIFPTTYATMFCCYQRVRKRAAELQKNPRLLSIELRTFRHWGGTMLAHYTNGNVLTVQRMLGHKRIENTMKYIGMINFKDDQFEVATATTVDEAKNILSAGFDYVTEKNGIMLFRRPKRFSAYVS
jgi:integrase/transcription elongation factor Elf1